jgi:hypothetical protein
MQAIKDGDGAVRFALAMTVGVALYLRMPFEDQNDLLQLVLLQKPYLFYAMKYAYVGMLFATPYIVASMLVSILYIFLPRERRDEIGGKLPPYPEVLKRDKLFVVLGETHHARRAEPAANPRWLMIDERGLFAGIAAFGAIGSGKTSGVILPFAEQVLGCDAENPATRIGGLVLEVKGDLCQKIEAILSKYNRAEDYVEIRLDGKFCYNPLYSGQEAYALAFGIATLVNNLYGRSKEPFWQQAYTNLVKFIILLHQILNDYVTLFDVYECAINPKLLEQKIEEGNRQFEGEYLSIEIEAFEKHPAFDTHAFVLDQKTKKMRVPVSQGILAYLKRHRIPYERGTEKGDLREGFTGNERKREQFEAVKRWFFQDWSRIEPKLRTSIIEGISVFLSLFDDNPEVKRIFCPPKAAYLEGATSDGLRPLPSWSDLLEAGKVVALNFPMNLNPGLVRIIGTLLKLDFERAVLNRIPDMEKYTNRRWREILFLCDEYQSFATVGEHDPTGDEKFFALSRQAKCIPIVATQSISSLRSTLPGESWRTLLQTFRTKIFLTLADDFSAETASRLCGKEEMLKPSYTLSETGQQAEVSMLTGKATSHRASLSTSKSYSTQMHPTFEPKVFAELKNAQSIVLAYDGLNPLAPTYCFLKPHHLDKNTTYFEQLSNGDL